MAASGLEGGSEDEYVLVTVDEYAQELLRNSAEYDISVSRAASAWRALPPRSTPTPRSPVARAHVVPLTPRRASIRQTRLCGSVGTSSLARTRKRPLR